MWDTLSSCSWAATAAAASPVSRCCSTIQTNQVTGHNLQIEHEHLYWFHPTFQASKDMKIQSQGKAYPRARRSCCAKARGNAQAPHRTRHSPSAIHCSDSMLIFLHRHKWQVHSLSSSIAQITLPRLQKSGIHKLAKALEIFSRLNHQSIYKAINISCCLYFKVMHHPVIA